MEAVGERNPVELMQRRAENLSHRSADLKKLADAWEPLYKTLNPDQKKRMAFATYAAVRGYKTRLNIASKPIPKMTTTENKVT
jgi:hypothetical protein